MQAALNSVMKKCEESEYENIKKDLLAIKTNMNSAVSKDDKPDETGYVVSKDDKADETENEKNDISGLEIMFDTLTSELIESNKELFR